MKRTITALWNGNLAPCDRCGADDPELFHLIDLMERNRENLYEITDPQQQKIFEKYVVCADEYLELLTERAFCDGFCLAGKLLTETLTADV